jgi:NAD dependent epimerase/dehydratase family enzyme
MKDATSYRRYASDCRRIAEKMSAKDKQILEQMAEAWESRAQEAERQNADGRDGGKK